MSDETGNEEIQIDPAHPWVQASAMMSPAPVPTGIELDSVTLRIGDGEDSERAAMLNIIDPTGVKNVFLPPPLLHYLFEEAANILKEWAEEDKSKAKIPNIILGDPHNLAVAKEIDKKNRHLKGI